PRRTAEPQYEGFEFIPVGAYVPEPGAVLESPRWDTIGETVRSEGAGLLLFVSADTPGLGILSGRIGRAVVLGGEREANRVAARLAPSCRIVGVAESVGDPERPPAVDAAAEAEAASSEAAELSEPVVFRSDRESRRRISPILLILLLAALIAAGWYAYQRYLATPAEEPAPQPGATQAEPVRPPPVRGDPVETPIPVSVAVEAHQDLAHARERVAALRDAESDIQFYLAPVSVRGSVYYRLLAGPVTDRTQGEALMDRLVEAGHKTSADVWSVLPTKLAFHLGEFETREAAERRVEMLATRGIPAYIVPVAYDPGSDQYRVYGGAFQSEHEAAVMGELLAEAGAQARLVERTGRPTPGAS
ncbi:MAG: SPOR domain-containing protein, partial [Gemmatimonadota bacterium]